MMDDHFEIPAAHALASLLPDGLESAGDAVVDALERENYSAALKAANLRYAEKGPTHRAAALTYVVLLVHRGLADEALGVLRRALEYHADAALQLAQVDALLLDERFDAALELMEALRSLEIADPRHLAYLGDQFLDIERVDDARACYEQALDRGSDDARVALRLARLELERDELSRAARHFETAGRLSPDNAAIWTSVGDAWLGLGEDDKAARAYKRVVSLDGDDDRAWMYLGIAHSEGDDIGPARRAFDKACHLAPDDPRHWLNLGHLELDAGNPEQGRQAYLKAVDLDPELPEALDGLVAAAFELGDMEMAEGYARDAVEVAPDNPDAHHNLGVIKLAVGELGAAEDAFRAAVEMEPEEPRYLASLAHTLLRSGDTEGSRELIEQVGELEPDDATAMLEYAQSLFRYATTDDALGFLDGARSDDPSWDVVGPVLRYLAHALRRDDHDRAALRDRFDAAVTGAPEAIPVLFDFDEIGRLLAGVEPEDRAAVEAMIDILEGRKESGDAT